jgi:uncharacterized protein YbcI
MAATEAGDPNGGARTRGTLSSAISNQMVHLFAEYTGRGPTKAKTTISDDLIVCVLNDALTKGERSLVAAGMAGEVVTMRRHFQTAMSEEAIAGIEELTGRKVLGFLSDSITDPDLSVEAFVLEPVADGSAAF